MGQQECINDRHQSNVILLYTQVQLPFLSTFAGIYCKVLILKMRFNHRFNTGCMGYREGRIQCNLQIYLAVL